MLESLLKESRISATSTEGFNSDMEMECSFTIWHLTTVVLASVLTLTLPVPFLSYHRISQSCKYLHSEWKSGPRGPVLYFEKIIGCQRVTPT